MRYQKVSPGDPLEIQAETWNALVDVAMQARGGGGRTGSAYGPAARSTTLVRVKNGTGSAIPRYRAVGVTGLVVVPPASPSGQSGADAVSEFLRDPVIVVGLPAASDAGRWLVLLEPLEAGQVGLAVAEGVTPCRVNVAAGAIRADVVAGSSLPSVSNAGYEILWLASGTGERWALLRVGGSAGAGDTVFVVATATAAGRGKYTGKIVLPPTGDVTASDDVDAADFGSSDDGATVLILNSMEVGSTATLTHPLRFNKPYIGRILRINSDGTPVVGVTVLEGDFCEEGV
jgi:hypothetical protein